MRSAIEEDVETNKIIVPMNNNTDGKSPLQKSLKLLFLI